MAEMTAEEHAIHVLKLSIQYNNDADPDDCRLALQVIERQAAEIDTQHEVLVYQQAENDRLRDEAEKEIAKLTEVAKAAEEFCQTAVYVQSQYSDDGSPCAKTSMDAVSKLNYFVKQWIEKESEVKP